MKTLSSLFIAVAFVLAGSAQEKSASKWTRIEYENKNFAVSFPPNFIVDAEKRERGQRYRVIGYQNGVRMELIVYPDGNAKKRLKELSFEPGARVSEFTVGNFKGKRLTAEEFDKEYFEYIFLASDDFYYYVGVRTKSKNKEELKRFLYSIHLGGKQLFQQKEKLNVEEETVLLDTLKTSPDVLEAYKRKSEKNKINISYETDSNQVEADENEALASSPIILDRPGPNYLPAFGPGDNRVEILEAKLKINFLANGQIGDIIVYSNAKKDYIESCVDSARKIKFIPAKIDGKYVNASFVVVYKMTIFSYPPIR